MVHGATGVMHLVTVVGASLVLLHLNPFVPALLLLASLPAMARQWEYVCRVGMHLYDQTPEARRLAYYREMLLSAEPAKDVRLYGLGAFFRQRYEGLFAATMHALDELRRGLIRAVALAGALSAAAMGLVYVYTVWLAVQGHLSVGDVVLYGGAVTLLQAELGALARGGVSAPRAALPAQSVPRARGPSRPAAGSDAAPCTPPHPPGYRLRACWVHVPGPRHAGAAGRLVLHSAGRVRGARRP
jgi:hypothetical protein